MIGFCGMLGMIAGESIWSSVLHLWSRVPSLRDSIVQFMRIQIRVHHPGKLSWEPITFYFSHNSKRCVCGCVFVMFVCVFNFCVFVMSVYLMSVFVMICDVCLCVCVFVCVLVFVCLVCVFMMFVYMFSMFVCVFMFVHVFVMLCLFMYL